MKICGGTSRRFGVAGVGVIVAAAICMVASAGADARGFNRPPRPAVDWPTVAGMVDAFVANHSGWQRSLAPSPVAGAVDTSGVTQQATAATSTGTTAGTHPAAPGAIGSSALVLYDSTGPFGWLGELYATAVGNLTSHFGTWTAEPVSLYQAGQISKYTATIYVGSTYDEALPDAFLDDVYNATRPVIWIYDNIWELSNKYASTFQSKYGWMWWQFDTSTVNSVAYKGTSLSRDGADNAAGIMEYSAVDPLKATTLATAVRSDGTTFPWALRTGNFTYIGENPFVYSSETDRLRIFEDLLFDALNPFAQTRHRALLRLEDISPSYDPADLKAVADYLYSQHIPYGFGVSPVYVDPLAKENSRPTTIKLSSAKGKGVASMIKYMQARGGTLVEHGYTHQYSNIPNPYDAVTDDDFEFYRTIENPDHTLTFQGPVPGDSAIWAGSRMLSGLLEFRAAGITTLPTIFEFPHYAGSAVDYQTAGKIFPTRWERVLYFSGGLTGGTVDYAHVIGQMFPYVVKDAYGTTVLPENLGDYEDEPFHQFPLHLVPDVLAAGNAESVVRDGVAGVYYHPFHGVPALQQIVTGLKAQGWTFVAPNDVATKG